MHDLRERLTGATALAVLGVALTALFLGYDWFWMVFVIGYAVVLPLVAILTGADDAGEQEERSDPLGDRIEATIDDALGRGSTDESDAAGSKADALERLRDRYARGELSDEQFERKLDRLLETETLEGAREYAGRGSDGDAVPERE